MIRFDRLESESTTLAEQFKNASPFSFVAIDNFCEPEALRKLVSQIPDPIEAEIGKSRDYIFAKNKFEKSAFRTLGDLFEEIYADLMSDRFKAVLSRIVGQDVWVDPEFHGGGIHQGGRDSFLDMHVDFSHHPLNDGWFRNLNILLYLNEGWEPSWSGQLDLRHKKTGESTKIEPLFNRCVIMHTRDYTLHGYGRLAFPESRYRRSIATYAYSMAEEGAAYRSTVWYPENTNRMKRLIGRSWPQLVALKTKFFGSATERNR
ncbi:MAG: 2OG-Fe(II) oxygenase [Sphingobium sp.]|nr:2OG-Fe(II) oxygenase [Sphingobium sp.]